MVPSPSLCPKCNLNPRRRPGDPCTPCTVAAKRDARRSKSEARRAKTETPEFKRKLRATKCYIITAAQNNTHAHAGFLGALKVAAKHLRAEIIVVPYRYKNPTSHAPGTDLRTVDPDAEPQLWWDPELTPYLLNQRTPLNKNLVLAADVKIQPTASDPLSGFEGLTGAESCIIAHPKLSFRTVAVPSASGFPKILTTTGAVTEPNYSNTKAGALGEFHYSLGATLVETDGKLFHLRQLLGTDDGSFIDLDKQYSAKGVSKAPPALGLVMGDTHVRITDPGVDRATFGKRGIVDTLQPQTLVFHDVFDGETVNPHEIGDLFLSAARQKAGRTDIRAELQQMVDFINARARGRDVVIVDSNHHDFLRRWVVRTLNNGCHDAKNLPVFLESALHMYETSRMTPGGAEYGDPFPYWVRKLGAESNIRCLEPDESFRLADVECGMHGHHGPNGSRGSMKNLARIGVKVIDGHGHAPGIFEGHWRVGTSTPRRQAYHRGPGNNLNAHCAVYANRKRCLISIIGDQWRLP